MRILVTGENSYAGRQFEKRMIELNGNWEIDFISVRNNKWKSSDFSCYTAIYHVAAIVHQKEKKENEPLYYKINRDLTYELAEKARLEGVKSFIFLSTIAVYGFIGRIGKDTIISKETIEKPTSYYGKSKLEAEHKINFLQSDDFQVSILRIPMIYGPNCPGNYSSLSKLAKKTPVFPKINNRRSMIFVDYLSDFVLYVIDNKKSGLFLVKNPNDVNTQDLIKNISKIHKRKIYYSNLLGLLVTLFGNFHVTTQKVFGNLYILDKDAEISIFEENDFTFKESLMKTEVNHLN